jgi:putative membrane protein
MKVLIIIFIPAILFLACNQRSPQEQASKDSTNAIKESMDDLDKSSVKFVTEVAERNIKEIELGKIAHQNAQYDRLKDFAARMITSHTSANEALQQASYAAGVTLPAGTGGQEYVKDFSGKKGPAFDKAYVKEMVSEHQKIMELLDEASHQLKDTALKHYATIMLPMVNAHLEEARVLLEDVRKQYRPEQGRDAHIK